MPDKTVAVNRRARHEYAIEETLEAGLALTGTEIKSIRAGRVNLAEAYARIERGEAWLIGAHIAPYEQGNRNNHEPTRTRKLLLHRDQIAELVGRTQAKGFTLVPLKLYIRNGMAKLEIGIARGQEGVSTSAAPSPSVMRDASSNAPPRSACACSADRARGEARATMNRSIGPWGCQVSTGLRDRELQVEVARMAS